MTEKMPPIKVVLPKQVSVGPAMGVRVFSGEHEIHWIQDVELDYSATDATKARLTVFVSEVVVEERRHE